MKTSSPSTSTGSPSPQIVVAWNIVHDICISYSAIAVGGGDEGKWNSFSSFRGSLAESVIRPALEDLLSALQSGSRAGDPTALQNLLKVRDNLKTMVNLWDEQNCFDSPTLTDEIRRLVIKIGKEDGSGSGTKPTAEAANQPNVGIEKNDGTVDDSEVASNDPQDDSVDDNDVSVEADNVDASNIEKDSEPSTKDDLDEASDNKSDRALTPVVESDVEMVAAPESEQDMDAEMSNAEQKDESSITETVQEKNEKEETKTLDDPKTDSSQESPVKKEQAKEFDFESQGIPEGKVEVREISKPCKAISTLQITRDVRHDSSHNLSSLLSSIPSGILDACRESAATQNEVDLKSMPAIPDDVLDLDVVGALNNVKLHREVIQKQKEHRQKCIDLLIKSRCKFGSEEAGVLFYELESVLETLKKRKANILDAMELEGLDFEAVGAGDGKDDENNFKDFPWLSKETTEKKRLRTE